MTPEEILKSMRLIVREEVKGELEPVRSEFVEKFDQVLTRMDKVYGEVLSMREEQSMHNAKHEDINERLDNIESVSVVAHELKKKKK